MMRVTWTFPSKHSEVFVGVVAVKGRMSFDCCTAIGDTSVPVSNMPSWVLLQEKEVVCPDAPCSKSRKKLYPSIEQVLKGDSPIAEPSSLWFPSPAVSVISAWTWI